MKFKVSGFMKTNISILLCLILCGCISEFEPKNTDETDGILVVEGIITDGESVITLSRSKGLSYEDNLFDLTPYHVTDAKVFIECDDGMQWGVTTQNYGVYTIATGKLNPQRQYRLKIEINETEKTYEYGSEYASPMSPPEIDTFFYTKKDKGQPVIIRVATHAPDDAVQYYRWTYREDWETRAEIRSDWHPFYCTKNFTNREILLGTTERTASNQLTEVIAKIPPSDDRFVFLYRMDIKQYAISKQAFDYYTNIKNNAQQTGGIFAHIPSEIKGNIACITDPARPVIGYMDISSVTQKRMYIYRSEVYEDPYLGIPNMQCQTYMSLYGLNPDKNWVRRVEGDWAELRCIDCKSTGGRSIRELPDDWPYQYVMEIWD